LIAEKNKAVIEIPKYGTRGSVYDEILHSKIMGNLDDPRLTREQRVNGIQRMKDDNEDQSKLHDDIIDKWNETKEFNPPKSAKKDEGKTVDFSALPPRR
jgi:hypothetical protein